MTTTNLKLSTVNKIETGYITGSITTIDMMLNKCKNSAKTIIKKAYSVLEKYGDGAGYALRR